jgi:MFS family permease
METHTMTHGPQTWRLCDALDLTLIATTHGLSDEFAGLLPLLAVERFDIGTAAIGVVVSFYYTVGIFSKAVMGFLYNRWGARLALLVPLLLGGVFALGIGLLPWQPALLPLAALLGFLSPLIGGWLATQFGRPAICGFFALMTWMGAVVAARLPATHSCQARA